MEAESTEITDQQPVTTNSQSSEVKPKTFQHHRTTIPLGPCQVNAHVLHVAVVKTVE